MRRLCVAILAAFACASATWGQSMVTSRQCLIDSGKRSFITVNISQAADCGSDFAGEGVAATFARSAAGVSLKIAKYDGNLRNERDRVFWFEDEPEVLRVSPDSLTPLNKIAIAQAPQWVSQLMGDNHAIFQQNLPTFSRFPIVRRPDDPKVRGRSARAG